MIQIGADKLPSPGRPIQILFANLVFLDCSVCNLTALSVYPDCLQQANQSGRSRWFLNNYCTRPYFSWPIPNYPDHFHEKMWYDLPLLVYVCGNTLHKKNSKVWSLQPIKPTCRPESGHQMCGLPICPAMSIRAALGEVRCCYCGYLILQHYLVGC